jgi:hypothetical protein
VHDVVTALGLAPETHLGSPAGMFAPPLIENVREMDSLSARPRPRESESQRTRARKLSEQGKLPASFSVSTPCTGAG